jgi:choline transporter-like protein 2/4/5
LPGLGQGLSATVHLKHLIGIWVGLSLAIAFVWIVLFRCTAGFIIYPLVILVPIVIAGIGVWFWFRGDHFFLFNHESNAHRICAGVLWAIAVIIGLVILFLWRKLKTAVAVIGIAGHAVWSNLTSLATPLISIILLVVLWAISLAAGLFTYTRADFMIENRTSAVSVFEETTSYLTMSLNHTMHYILIYLVIYLIFISVHVYFTNYYAHSSAIVDWYFQGGIGGPCNLRCLYGFGIAFFKGLGTIALCSLIMTPLYVLILICEWLDRKSRQEQSTLCIFVRFLICCMKCCLWCFEKLLRYLNKSLLTISQIYNTGWWASAKITLSVLLGDALMVAVMNGITTFIIFLSKLVVAGLTTFGFLLTMKAKEQASAWFIPAVIVFASSFIIASFLLGMFANVIDIVFLCYLADQDLTGSGAQCPYYGCEELRGKADELKTSGGEKKVEGSDTVTP